MKTLFTYFIFAVVTVACIGCAPKVPESDRVLTEIDSLYCSGNAENMAKAREMLRELERDYPRYSDLLVFLGIHALDDEQYDMAVDYFTRAIKYYGKASKFDHYYLYGIRAFAYRDMGNYEAAVCDLNKSYELALDDDPEVAIRAILYRADVRYKQQMYDESNADCEWILSQDSLNYEAIICIARNHNAQGLYSEAIELVNKSEQINPDYYAISKIRMQSYLGLGEMHKAIDDAVRFVELTDPAQIGEADLIMNADISYAHKCIDAQIEQSANSERLQFYKSNLYILAGEFDKCMSYLSTLEKRFGERYEIMVCRAKCYQYMGDAEKEQIELAKAFELAQLDNNKQIREKE